MQDLVAFGLTADHEDTFTGGVLAVDGADFHLRDSLEAGDGAIVVHANDATLVDILDALRPPLKRIDVPEGAEPISRYDRRSHDDLQHFASLRDLPASGSHADLVARLEEYDTLNPAELAASTGDTSPPDPDADTTREELESHTVAALEDLAAGREVDLAGATKKDDIIDRLLAAGQEA